MLRDDLRFNIPATAEEELDLARQRVRERREGLRVSALVFGGCALAGTAFAVAARVNAGAAMILVPSVVILVVLPAAGLAIVAISSLIWRDRLHRLVRRRRASESASLPYSGGRGPFRAQRGVHGHRRPTKTRAA